MIRIIVLASILWTMPVIFSGIAALGGEAVAAEKEKKKKTRRVPALRESTYRRLGEAQLMIDPESVPREEGEPVPEATGTPRDAVNLLMDFLNKRGLNSYEKAQIWNTLAFAYYTLEDMKNTIHSYEMVLQQGVISEALEQQSLRALFQLHFGEGNYRKAIEYITKFEEARGQLDAAITFWKALAYYSLDEFPEALKYAVLVEEVANEQGKEMEENWWYLQVVLYNTLQDVDNVIVVLEKLIVHYPKKSYWMLLAGMYSEKEWDDQSLSAYYAAYTQGFFVRESEIVMLSQRLLNAEVPYEAAEVLEQGFTNKILKNTEKNLKLLATSYTMAQEVEKAITAWENAAKKVGSGENYYRLAQALAHEEHHSKAIKAYRSSLNTKDLVQKKESDAYFWMGISLMALDRWDEAVRAFRSSQKADAKKSKMVAQYITYITGEKRRLAELKRMQESTGAE
jgi:tetratricopeptide (TPR) repeat protein